MRDGRTVKGGHVVQDILRQMDESGVVFLRMGVMVAFLEEEGKKHGIGSSVQMVR